MAGSVLQVVERINIDAPADRVHALVADPLRHAALAGSGEVLAIRVLTPPPVRSGTRFEADEAIAIGPFTKRFTATSEIVEMDPPRVISWVSIPPSRPRPRRIQWWVHIEAVGASSDVEHVVEVDWGPVGNVVIGLLYRRLRSEALRVGMQETLRRLRAAATAPTGSSFSEA